MDSESTAGYLQAKSIFSINETPEDLILVPWVCPDKYRNEALVSDVKTDSSVTPIYVDDKLLEALKVAKREFGAPEFRSARDAVYGFSKLGSSIFSSRSALHLAAVDYALHVTGKWSSFEMYDDIAYGVVDLCAAPGSWTEYVYYRHPRATGVGISLISDNPEVPKWSEKLAVTPGTFTKWTKGQGDLYTQWDKFEAPLSDLVMFDAGFPESKDKPAEEQVETQEYRYSRLWTAAVCVSLRTSKPGANAVFKVFDLFSEYSAQLLYLMSWCWKEIVLYKPPTSRPLNAEVCIVCRGFKGSGTAQQLINSAMIKFTDSQNAVKIFSNHLPSDFVDWLKSRNDALVKGQIDASTTVLHYMYNLEVDVPIIDPVQVFIKWHLPGSVPSRGSSIRLEQPRTPRLKDGTTTRDSRTSSSRSSRTSSSRDSRTSISRDSRTSSSRDSKAPPNTRMEASGYRLK